MNIGRFLTLTIIALGLSTLPTVDNAKVERKHASTAVQTIDKDHRIKERRGIVHTLPIRRGHKNVIVPRHRHVHKTIVVRRYGHAYLGYGGFYNDDDAWKWLAFTAITMKILDNLNEQAQREHEAAQIKATSAPVGEKITWNTQTSTGYVVATKQGKNESGQQCREFLQEVTVGGKTEQAYGTACLQPDGAWKIIS